jgi:hypothetical protein
MDGFCNSAVSSPKGNVMYGHDKKFNLVEFHCMKHETHKNIDSGEI